MVEYRNTTSLYTVLIVILLSVAISDFDALTKFSRFYIKESIQYSRK